MAASSLRQLHADVMAAEAKLGDARLQVEGEAVVLPLLTAIISGIGQQPGCQERKGCSCSKVAGKRSR
jgi:hypothetical protein